MPNYALKPKGNKRTYIGPEISEVRDFSQVHYRRPVEKGYVVHWPLQRDVWTRALGDEGQGDDDVILVATEQPFTLPAVRAARDETVFERMGVGALATLACGAAVARAATEADGEWVGAKSGAVLVLDSGYSFTHAVPVLHGQVLHDAVRRIDLGGKALTNYLKEIVSYREWNMMDETHVMNTVKERLCYCSTDFLADLKASAKTRRLFREFVLPDYHTNVTGYVKGEQEPPEGVTEQVLRMNNERITVPEALFHPSDIGLNQAGIAEAVHLAVQATPEELHPAFYSAIVTAGGNSRLPGFREKLAQELRPYVPSHMDMDIRAPDDPVSLAWLGAAAYARDDAWLARSRVTRAEYEELGAHALQARREAMR